MSGPLPTFLIVGTMKGGTTSLAAWLAAHPDVFVAPEKELNFFDDPARYALGEVWYRSHFTAAGAAAAIGEATPSYMANPDAVSRMAAMVPDARLVVALRHPVDRAYSHYRHLVDDGVESRDFETAVADEQRDPAAVHPIRGYPLGYLARGRYAAQLERLCTHYPREAVHVVLFDDLTRDPAGTYRALCRFLGVADDHVPAIVGRVVNPNPRRRYRSRRASRALDRIEAARWAPRRVTGALRRVNERALPGGYAPMDPATRAALLEWFADDNARLADWLDRPLDGWAV